MFYNSRTKSVDYEADVCLTKYETIFIISSVQNRLKMHSLSMFYRSPRRCLLKSNFMIMKVKRLEIAHDNDKK